MNVARLLERSALYLPARTALVAGDRSWTYTVLNDEVSAVAAGLAAHAAVQEVAVIGMPHPVRGEASPRTLRARSSRRTFARADSF